MKLYLEAYSTLDGYAKLGGGNPKAIQEKMKSHEELEKKLSQFLKEAEQIAEKRNYLLRSNMILDKKVVQLEKKVQQAQANSNKLKD